MQKPATATLSPPRGFPVKFAVLKKCMDIRIQITYQIHSDIYIWLHIYASNVLHRQNNACGVIPDRSIGSYHNITMI